MRRLSLYAFIITLAWMCFVIAIAFIDAPAKFEALGLKKPWTEVTTELKNAVRIGYHSFHKLNIIEWICCGFSWLLAMRLRVVRERWSLIPLAVVTVIHAVQSWMLYAVLDARTVEIIHGTLPAESWHHLAYIIADGVKVLVLGVLFAAQIQTFARVVISE